MVKNRNFLVYALLIVVMASGFSCSAIDMKKNQKDGKSLFSIGEEKEEKSAPLYYEFKDILIPGELIEDKNHSSVIGTGDAATGFLSFYGRVELRSVVHFFKIKVPEDGWKFISIIKSPFSTNMIFQKNKRWCLITLQEKGFTTEVGVGVSPEL